MLLEESYLPGKALGMANIVRIHAPYVLGLGSGVDLVQSCRQPQLPSIMENLHPHIAYLGQALGIVRC
jgi:hypothetical protein